MTLVSRGFYKSRRADRIHSNKPAKNTMEQQRAEGIILQALPFKDYDSILTLFTPEEGLLKVVLKGAFRQKNGKGNRTIPLTRVEAAFKRGRGELATCHEIDALDYHLELRHNLDALNAGCAMLKAVLDTQQPGKAAPDLYKLLLIYLKNLPTAQTPAILSASFFLKVLRHEGVYAFDEHCAACQAPILEHHLFGGETYCSRHAPPQALSLCLEERQLLTFLAFCRDLSQLKELSLPPSVLIKAQELFKHSL